jgi:hypothetical protein
MLIKAILLGLMVVGPVTLTLLPPGAHAADGVVYEVSEAIDVNAKGFRSSSATLSGAINAGTPLCPSWVASELGTDSCWIIVHAVGGADSTGVGPVKGTMFVLAQGRNLVDAPEVRILTADFEGELDLTAAFFLQIPRGTIVGQYSAKGERGSIMAGYKATGGFDGIFRLPFLYLFQGKIKPCYLFDDGTIKPLESGEYSVGQPTPRLELFFTGSAHH